METIINVNEVLSAIGRFIRRRSGLNFQDYGGGTFHYADKGAWKEAYRAYSADARQVTNDGRRARRALEEALAMREEPELLRDSFRAFSGRLEWDGKELHYTTEQYFPTEYRKAAAAVLESYVAACRRKLATEKPREFVYATVADVKAANQATGGHWFDPGSMRFFRTKIVSELMGGRFFVTSETGPTERTLFTIREGKPDGDVDTIGEFQQYSTRGDALKAVRELLREGKPKVEATINPAEVVKLSA